MSKIKSDLTSRSFSDRQFKELDVSDESQIYNPSQGDPELEAEINSINLRLSQRGQPPVDAQMIAAMASRRNQQYQPESQNDSLKEVEQRIKETKRQKFSGRERLSDVAKRRVEMLCGFSKNTRDINIDGDVYTLKTLKAKEMRAALVAASAFDGTIDLPFETRRHLLARSLTHVAGNEIDLFLNDEDLETKLEFLEELDELCLGQLYDSYLQLVADVKARYAVKSDEDAQGVLSDLKK